MANDCSIVKTERHTLKVRPGYLYSDEGVWVAWDQGTGHVRLGLTDYRQQASGKIVFVELPMRGMALAVGDELANVESVRVDLSVPSPVSGTITALNSALSDSPELINQDPYGSGWLLEMRPDDWPVPDLMDHDAYFAQMVLRAEEATQ